MINRLLPAINIANSGHPVNSRLNKHRFGWNSFRVTANCIFPGPSWAMRAFISVRGCSCNRSSNSSSSSSSNSSGSNSSGSSSSSSGSNSNCRHYRWRHRRWSSTKLISLGSRTPFAHFLKYYFSFSSEIKILKYLVEARER